ncbi:hypothetical protein [uncultured Acinetobacter sp.]|uniref:hypothetical protein n=1 Tax=uncultured Acinetobacter sp. TaxID=165433 RepID=UPI002590A77C|nr:hypothetical protein [uncultured Acinetobacter sp.]
MSFYEVEHQHATRLEQNLQEFYQQARFQKSILNMQHWHGVFLDTLPDWKPLMFYQELEFDLWITIQVYCYHATLNDLKLVYLSNEDVEQIKLFIALLLEKLRLVFTGVNFLETIKANNEEHAKRIRKCVKQYEEITKHHHRLNTVKCYFTYQADQIPLVSIFDLTKHISTFEKRIQKSALIQSGCLYLYRKVFRVPEKNQYVCAYFLTFNSNVLKQTEMLYQQLNQEWLMATYGNGLMLDSNSDLPWEERDDGFLAMFEEMEDACEDLEGMAQQEFYNVGDKATRLRVRPRKFQQFMGRSIKGFNF